MALHMHRWVETARLFNPPTVQANGPTESTGTSGNETIVQLLYGFTAVELRCERCGDVKGIRYAGAVKT